jgi:hypothetical protein
MVITMDNLPPGEASKGVQAHSQPAGDVGRFQESLSTSLVDVAELILQSYRSEGTHT